MFDQIKQYLDVKISCALVGTMLRNNVDMCVSVKNKTTITVSAPKSSLQNKYIRIDNLMSQELLQDLGGLRGPILVLLT